MDRVLYVVAVAVLVFGYILIRGILKARKAREQKAPIPEAAVKVGEEQKKKKTIYQSIETYVYNTMIMQCRPATLSGDIVAQIIRRSGSIGVWRTHDNGKKYYSIGHDRQGYYQWEYPDDITDSAGELHRRIKHPEIQGIWNVEPLKTFGQKYGLYLLLAGAVVFAIWSSMQ